MQRISVRVMSFRVGIPRQPFSGCVCDTTCRLRWTDRENQNQTTDIRGYNTFKWLNFFWSPPILPTSQNSPKTSSFPLHRFHFMDLSSGNAESDCLERSRLYRLGCRNLNQPPHFGGLPSQQRHCAPEVEVRTMQTGQHLVSHYPSHCFNLSDWRSLRVTLRRWSTHCLHQIACQGRQTILVLLHSRWQVGFVIFATISHFIF